MTKLGMLLEMELGVTGGEEDGVDNSHVKKEDLYSKPEEIYEVQRRAGRSPGLGLTRPPRPTRPGEEVGCGGS